MQVTLFGGSFNPPHLGHALIIQEFLASGLTDQLWLLPAHHHTFNKHLHFAPVHHRLAMCQLLIDSIPINHLTNQLASRLCSIEIDLQLSGQTYQTLQQLKSNIEYLKQKSLYSTFDIQFSFLMGSDQLPNFEKWGNWEKLLEEMTFWVYPRAGHSLKSLKAGMKAFTSNHQTITNFSSSLIRERLKTGFDTSLILLPEISEYIKKNELYQ